MPRLIEMSVDPHFQQARNPLFCALRARQADTWRDETLRQVISASFLFWQQYYDSPAGSTFCRFYLPNATGPTPVGLPHIAVVDPVTGASVKTWTGFKDSERLMDKLMEYADEPPCDMMAAAFSPSMMGAPSGQLSPLKPDDGGAGGGQSFTQPSFGGPKVGGEGGDDESAELAAAIAASLAQGDGAAAGGAAAVEPAAPAGPSEAEVDAMWGAPVDEPSDGGMALKIRLLDGSNFMRKFLPTHTLRDVLCAIHFSGSRLDPQAAYRLCAPMARVNANNMEGTLSSQGVERGAYTLSEG